MKDALLALSICIMGKDTFLLNPQRGQLFEVF